MNSTFHDSQKIALVPVQEKPRERCLETGPSCLSLRECLALILGSGPPGSGCLGLAQKILTRPGDGLGSSEEERAFFMGIETCGRSHLLDIPGLGPAGQARILAAVEMGRRYALFRTSSDRLKRSQKASGSADSQARLAIQSLQRVSELERNAAHEWFGFVPVYRTGTVGHLCLVERGSRTHVNLDPVEIFARLLSLRPQAFFLVHNHPSGSSLPSLADSELTQRIDQVARTFGIHLLGHWIVSPQEESWISPPPLC